jgi:citrate synthase
MSDSAKLFYKGQEFEFPVIVGTENEPAIDIAKLRSDTGLITLDSGFKNTGSTTSSITFLDGEEGILRYRGYRIEDLAEKSSFMEVAYLLIYGELPTQAQFDDFTKQITYHTLVHEDIKKILDGFPSNAHPMGVLSSLICSLSAFYPDSLNPNE